MSKFPKNIAVVISEKGQVEIILKYYNEIIENFYRGMFNELYHKDSDKDLESLSFKEWQDRFLKK